MRLVFEWDEVKAEQNLRKHGITFEEARTIFGDPFAMTIADREHSADENRYVDIGTSATGAHACCRMHRERRPDSHYQLPESYQDGAQSL